MSRRYRAFVVGVSASVALLCTVGVFSVADRSTHIPVNDALSKVSRSYVDDKDDDRNDMSWPMGKACQQAWLGGSCANH